MHHALFRGRTLRIRTPQLTVPPTLHSPLDICQAAHANRQKPIIKSTGIVGCGCSIYCTKVEVVWSPSQNVKAIKQK